jgi:hypothetical protein
VRLISFTSGIWYHAREARVAGSPRVDGDAAPRPILAHAHNVN